MTAHNLVSLYPSFKVMFEFANSSGEFLRKPWTFDAAEIQGRRRKTNLLRVWHYIAVTSICRCIEKNLHSSPDTQIIHKGMPYK